MRKAAEAEGAISASEVYGLSEFRRRSGMGDAAIREARRSGLVVDRAGGRAYVRGAEFIRWLASQSNKPERKNDHDA